MSNTLVWAAALWWGSLTALSFWIVPLLFWHLPSAAIAGGMAAKLFYAQTWVSLGCAAALLSMSRGMDDNASQGTRRRVQFWVVVGMLSAALVEFVIAPHILARENLRIWHSVGSGLYLLQWCSVSMCLHRLLAQRAQAQV